jgi:hypothetical protein
MTTSSGISGTSMFKSQAGPSENIHGNLHHVGSASSERSLELMRLKKEYNHMVKKEISKVKKDNDFYNEISKSPERSGASSVAGYYPNPSHQSSIA